MKKKRMMYLLAFLIMIPIAFYLFANCYVFYSGQKDLLTLDKANALETPVDAILVLGAGVRADHSPTHMLEDRLLTALKLYEKEIADAIIVSGDHGQVDYDEVNVMKDYLIAHGVPSERIFMDHAGFSTYDSLYRAKAIFGVESLVVVTQEYHAYRALMIGKSLGIDATAVSAPILATNAKGYAKQGWYSFRETVARTKDMIVCFFRPEPKFLGEKISLSESGDCTNDKQE